MRILTRRGAVALVGSVMLLILSGCNQRPEDNFNYDAGYATSVEGGHGGGVLMLNGHMYMADE